MKRFLLLVLVSVSTLQLCAQRPVRSFHVFLKDKKIGVVDVFEQKSDTHTIRELKTVSDAKVLAFAVHVEADVKVKKKEKVLVEGTAYRHANRGPADIHALTKKTDNQQYEREQNGKKSVLPIKEITYCVVDLYFSEPKGLARIFSNMYADFVTVKSEGNGRYEVTTPDKKKTYYTYKLGELVSIEAETPLGTVVSRKV